MKPEMKDMFCSLDWRLWKLNNEVMLRWNTACPFKWTSFNVPEGTRGMVVFLVPEDATYRYEIEAFLKKELESLKADNTVLDGITFPGTDVTISAYVGSYETIEPYITQEQSKAVAAEMARQLLQMIQRHDRK